MSVFSRSKLILLIFVLLKAQSALAVEFPVPKFFDLSIVSDDMSYSGIALSVSYFSSSEGVEKIEDFYKGAWPDNRVSALDNLYVISYLDEDNGLLYAVQINGDWESQQRPEGLLSISNIPDLISDSDTSMPQLGAGFPLHVSANVINDMRFNDGARKSRFLYLVHSANASTVYDHYQRSLSQRGWVELSADFSPREHFGIIKFQKEGRRLDITIKFIDGKTQMTAVELY